MRMVRDKEVDVIVLKQICPRRVRWEATGSVSGTALWRSACPLANGNWRCGDDAALLLSKVSASCVGEDI